MSIGQIRYSVKPNAQGRVRSDLTLWRCSEDVFEIISGNECRMSPSVAEFGLSALPEDTEGSPKIKLVAFVGGFNSKSNSIIWQPTSPQFRRAEPGEIMVTSSCFSRLFDCVTGPGFVTFDETTDVMIDPQEEFYNVKLCPLSLYDPHKTRPRRAWQTGPR
jgi:glycine cleavage system aminomethyltransferase T